MTSETFVTSTPFATFADRGRARAIDAIILFALFVPLAAISDAFDADTTAASTAAANTTDTSDPVATFLGFAIIAIAFLYDPVTTAWLGATPGKKVAGLGVVVEGTNAPAPVWRVALRAFAEWTLFGFCVVPWVLSIVTAREDRLGRTLHDKFAGTVVVPGNSKRTPAAARRGVSREPWLSAVGEAKRAQRRFTDASRSMRKGPLRERLGSVSERVKSCVDECEALAERGEQLAELAEGIDQRDVSARAESAAADAAAHPDDHSRASLASALANEAASAHRVVELVAVTERSLRSLVAQMNDAVNRAIEITYSDASESGFASLVDELESLRVGFVEAREAAGPSGGY